MKLSKVFRNTFFEGMHDAFDIIMGNHGIFDAMYGHKTEYRFGVLDLFVLPLIAMKMTNYGFPSKPIEGSAYKIAADETKTGFFRRAVGWVGLILEVAKGIAAFGVTVAVFPLVLAIHIIKYPFSKLLERQFYTLHGITDNSYQSQDTNNIVYSLAHFAERHNVTLNGLNVKKTEANIEIYAQVTDQDFKKNQYSGFKSRFFHATLDLAEDKTALIAGRMLGFNL